VQEMKKRRIVLASLLKPLDDTRMFEKIGLSLSQTGVYEMHIVGYPSGTAMNIPNVQLYPLLPFKRIGFGRVTARFKILKIIIKVKPELLIVTSHELLGVAILIRILFGSKIIYDIQENYWRNILYTNAFPKPFRLLIACLVRFKEWISSPLFSQFLLAEKCYVSEIGFIRDKFSVIENKCKIPEGFVRNPNRDTVELIFTGTIAESTGIFQAIDLSKKLHSSEPKIRLKIIGHSPRQNVIARVEKEVSENSFIQLIGGRELVPHSEIMKAIGTASFGLICYSVSPQNEQKIPTKLYEYLACRLPIIIQNHKPWTELCRPLDAAIDIDFNHADSGAVLNQINSGNFYSCNAHTDSVTWQEEETKLLKLISAIF
jgi:glycosyltransferase involved in cell wall biosynthesis